MESWNKMFNEHLFMKHWCDIYLEKVNLGTTMDENFSSGSIFTIFSSNKSGGKPLSPLLIFVHMSKILKKSTKVDKMEVSKQFPMVKEQLVYKLEGIALHEERKLEEFASVSIGTDLF